MTDPTIYNRLIVKLLYLTFSRPKISFAVQHLSQIMQNPMDSHYQETLRILHYIKQELGLKNIFFANSDISLAVFCDSD